MKTSEILDLIDRAHRFNDAESRIREKLRYLQEKMSAGSEIEELLLSLPTPAGLKLIRLKLEVLPNL